MTSLTKTVRGLGPVLIAVAAALTTGTLTDLHSRSPQARLAALLGTGVFVLAGAVAVRSSARRLELVGERRLGAPSAAPIRLLASLAGYLVVLLTALALLAVPTERLLLSGAVTGVIVGIAAQQVLANVFAGIVLIFSRPFTVGDRISIHNGGLGGTYTGLIVGVDLTYVTLAGDDGELRLPNAAVLAAAIGPPVREEAAVAAEEPT